MKNEIKSITEGSIATLRWRSIGLFVLLPMFFMHLDKHVLVVLAPFVIKEYHLSIVAMTEVLAATPWCYAIFQIPGAAIASRTGPWLAISLCLTAWSVVMLATPLAAAPIAFLMLRGLLGAFQAPDWSSSMMILEREASAEQRSRVSAALLFAAYLGAFLSGPVSVAIADKWGWRASFYVVGTIGLCLGASILRNALRSRPMSTDRQAQETDRGATMREVLGRPDVHVIAMAYLLFLGVQSFVYVLLPLFLVEVHRTKLSETGWLASAPYVTLYLAVLAAGFSLDGLLKRTRSLFYARVPAGAFAMAGCGACFALGMSAGNVLTLMCWTCTGMALAGVGQVVLWSTVQDLSAGTGAFTAAWVQVLGAVGLATTPIICAYIVENTHSWDTARFVFPFAGLAAALCLCTSHLLNASKVRQRTVLA